jgi:hypothetical protein
MNLRWRHVMAVSMPAAGVGGFLLAALIVRLPAWGLAVLAVLVLAAAGFSIGAIMDGARR